MYNKSTKHPVSTSKPSTTIPTEKYEQLQFELDFDDECQIIKDRSITARSRRLYRIK